MKAKTSVKKKYYDMTYIRDKCKYQPILLNKETDADIIEHLAKQENKNAYLKALIRADMGK